MIDITQIDDNLIENVNIGTCEKRLSKFESSLKVTDFSILTVSIQKTALVWTQKQIYWKIFNYYFSNRI